MKQFITLMLLFMVAMIASAQERTVSLNMGEGSYYKYTGSPTSDVLIPTTNDTIDFLVTYTGQRPVTKVALKMRYDMRTTADTTVSVSVFGKEFVDDPTYVQIIGASASGAVTANNTIQILASDYYETIAGATDTFNADSTTTVAARTVTPFDKSYRVYRIRAILSGNDSVGTGVKIDELELKFY